jgi:hypothetical protein
MPAPILDLALRLVNSGLTKISNGMWMEMQLPCHAEWHLQTYFRFFTLFSGWYNLNFSGVEILSIMATLEKSRTPWVYPGAQPAIIQMCLLSLLLSPAVLFTSSSQVFSSRIYKASQQENGPSEFRCRGRLINN